MNKELNSIKSGRVLFPKSVNFSKWQVDEAAQIPILSGLVPVPLWSPSQRKRFNHPNAPKSKRWATLVVMLLGLCACFSTRASQSVSIEWNPNTNSGTAGYVLYAGSSPANYTAQLNVGTNTTVTLTGLTEGKTNYFAVSAYNTANIIGAPSPPISYIVPGLMVLTPGTGATRTPSMAFPTAPGHWYEVQASTNLTAWTNIYQTPTATSNVWLNYTDPQAGSFPHRFYRLVMH